MSAQIDTGTDTLLCDIKRRVATITLNRPEKRNALSDSLTPALRQTLLDLETRDDVGCIVITGAGGAFCAGGDIGGMGENRTSSDVESAAAPPTMQNRVRQLIHKQETLTLRLYDHSKPTIAALPGVAAGAGLCIALACDLRIGGHLVSSQRLIATLVSQEITVARGCSTSWWDQQRPRNCTSRVAECTLKRP